MTPSQSVLSKACLHTITTRPWKLDIAIHKYVNAGIGGISVWQNFHDDFTVKEASALLNNSGLRVVSLVRGGFFTGSEEKIRLKAVEDNKRMIDEALAINADMLVLVCGSTPGQSLALSREQIARGIEAILPVAEKNKIKLTIEALHPVYSDSRSAVNTLKLANDLVIGFDSPWLGIAVDVYHVWWDPDLKQEIFRSGEHNKLFAFHLCDWRTPTRDILNDRELMGRGIINIQEIINWMNAAGFSGMYEVEIFSEAYWSMDQDEYLSQIIASLQNYEY